MIVGGGGSGKRRGGASGRRRSLAVAAFAASSSAEARIAANSSPRCLAACLAPTPEMTRRTSKPSVAPLEAGLESVQRAKSASEAADVEAWSGR